MRQLIRLYRLNFVILFFAAVVLSSCNKAKKDPDLWKALFLLTDPSTDAAAYYARIYRIMKSGSSFTATEVNASTRSALVAPDRPKLLIVHGWFTNDRNSNAFPSSENLKKRILDEGYWGKFFTTDEFALLYANYDIYAYDYLTSVHIKRNGELFRERMDTAFGQSESSKLSIYAHSMGGLVTRTAVYAGSASPSYLKNIFTTGTPYHGSPWASPEWIASMGDSYLGTATVAALAAEFLTKTEGGRDLRWDNFDNKIPGAENAFLSELNSRSDRDHFFKAYYGNCTNTSSNAGCSGTDPDKEESLALLCIPLRNTSDSSGNNAFTGADFNPSDCVVPVKSAISAAHDISDYSILSASDSKFSAIADIGSFDHFDIKMTVQKPRLQLVADLLPP